MAFSLALVKERLQRLKELVPILEGVEDIVEAKERLLKYGCLPDTKTVFHCLFSSSTTRQCKEGVSCFIPLATGGSFAEASHRHVLDGTSCSVHNCCETTTVDRLGYLADRVLLLEGVPVMLRITLYNKDNSDIASRQRGWSACELLSTSSSMDEDDDYPLDPLDPVALAASRLLRYMILSATADPNHQYAAAVYVEELRSDLYKPTVESLSSEDEFLAFLLAEGYKERARQLGSSLFGRMDDRDIVLEKIGRACNAYEPVSVVGHWACSYEDPTADDDDDVVYPPHLRAAETRWLRLAALLGGDSQAAVVAVTSPPLSITIKVSNVHPTLAENLSRELMKGTRRGTQSNEPFILQDAITTLAERGSARQRLRLTPMAFFVSGNTTSANPVFSLNRSVRVPLSSTSRAYVSVLASTVAFQTDSVPRALELICGELAPDETYQWRCILSGRLRLQRGGRDPRSFNFTDMVSGRRGGGGYDVRLWSSKLCNDVQKKFRTVISHGSTYGELICVNHSVNLFILVTSGNPFHARAERFIIDSHVRYMNSLTTRGGY